MIVSLSMMKKFLGEDVNIDDIMHRLEHHLEVEVEDTYTIVPNFYDVVVGRIIDKKEKGYVVDIGDREILVSSFGSVELPRYMHVAVAPAGSVIGDVTVEKRGNYEGIIPTLSMLGIPDIVMLPSEGGVPVFPYEIEVGTPLEDALGLPETVFDIYIAPPRGDLGSVWGFVREIGRVFGLEVKNPEFPRVSIGKGSIVEIESLDDTPVYIGVLIKGVHIDESPWWLQRTLSYLGIRPIYNVVDITNYYLAVYGQPMHAFDWDKIKDKVIVRRAKAGEILKTLDGVERKLDEDILVIADAEKPIAIAGVMGGENTEISEDTENIFLEVAYFTPLVVARSSRKLSLRTDASYRFERGIDPAKLSAYAKMAAEDIVKIAGGKVVSMEKVGDEWDTKEISLNVEKANVLLGRDLDWEKEIIRLGFQWQDGKVVVPSFRHDLNITEDIVDEVVKKWGYEEVPEELPTYAVTWDPDDDVVVVEERLAHDLASHGLMEVWTLSLMDPDDVKRAQVGDGVSLLNPVSKLYSVLRPHLLPSLLLAQKSNEVYGIDNVFLFEIGKIFPDLKEKRQVGILVAGDFVLSDWRHISVPADFFFLKGILEDVFRRWGIRAQWKEAKVPYIHPVRGASIVVDDKEVGVMGDLHPDIAEAFDLRNRPVVAFIDFELFENYMKREKKAKVPIKSPALWRDISMIVPYTVSMDSILSTIRANAGEHLEEIEVIDVFEDEKKIGKDLRSITIRLIFRKPDGAIQSEEADIYMSNIYNKLEDMGIKIRR